MVKVAGHAQSNLGNIEISRNSMEKARSNLLRVPWSKTDRKPFQLGLADRTKLSKTGVYQYNTASDCPIKRSKEE